MGLLQRNFLELASGSGSDLEVALVIDGTESMAEELAGVQKSIDRMLADLRRLRPGEIRAAIVVYRDFGSPSGECDLPLPEFTADADRIAAAIDGIGPESGAPFFPELPDVGLYRAITELPWSEDPSVSKWILMFGDAPPYDASFQSEAHPSARRRYGDDVLSSLASGRGVQIHCVLCTSGGDANESHTAVIDRTRGFMNGLAAGTGGIMLDLSYPAIQDALVRSADSAAVEFAKIDPIGVADLRKAKRIESTGDLPRTVSLAVMPHAELQNVSFDPSQASVQVSTAIRHRFGQMAGVRIASPVDIRRHLRRLRAEGLSETHALRGLASRLGVDYVVWGEIPEQTTYRTAAYRRTDGSPWVQVEHRGRREGVADALLTAAATRDDADEPLYQLASRLAGLSQQNLAAAKIAETTATTSELLEALESLEQSLALEAGDPDSRRLLQAAKRAAESAAAAEPRNAMAHWLAANADFNLAAIAFGEDDADAGKALMETFRRSLRRAERSKQSASPSLAMEIEADYQLLVAGDVTSALKAYERMVDAEMPLDTQRRGHWMLCGVYAGDWGVPASVMDLNKARQHVVELLANWPDSPETKQLKRWLLWDDQTDRSKHDYLPRVHVDMSADAI